MSSPAMIFGRHSFVIYLLLSKIRSVHAVDGPPLSAFLSRVDRPEATRLREIQEYFDRLLMQRNMLLQQACSMTLYLTVFHRQFHSELSFP